MSNDQHLLPQNMVALQHLEKLLKAGKGTTYERDFGAALLALKSRDIDGWIANVEKITAEKADGWEVPALYNAYFAKDGYTVLGNPRIYQQKAIEILKGFSSIRPEDPGPLTLYVLCQLNDPNTRKTYFSEILPCARKLVRLYPDYPYYHFILGYCEMRCGDPYLAVDAYITAETLFKKYQKKHSLAWRNCKTIIDCKIGIISSYILQENYALAYKAADDLLKITPPKRKLNSLSSTALKWEAETFPLRIACMENNTERMKLEAGKLYAKVKETPYKERAPYENYWETLSHYVKVRTALDVGDTAQADKSMERFILSGAKLMLGQDRAVVENETMYWSRGNILISALENELKTRYELAEKDPDKVTVITWVTKAIDNQEYSRDLMPPLWLYPMETFKGDYLYGIGNYKDAIKSYDEAYNRFPNHLDTTKGIEKCLRKLGEEKKADQIRKILEKMLSRKG